MLDKLLARPGATAVLASIPIGLWLCVAGHPDYGLGLLLGMPALWGFGTYINGL